MCKFNLEVQLRSVFSMKKPLRVCPSGRGCIAPESVESISNTIKKETEVSLGLTIFVLL